MKKISLAIALLSGLAVAGTGYAANHSNHAHDHSQAPMTTGENDVVVTMHLISNQGIEQEIGTVTLSDSAYGLLISPNLSEISSGIHGFHVHQNGSCEPLEKEGQMVAGLAAGGHFDPHNTGQHLGPYAEGHLGDLPPLIADEQGMATLQVLAPRLKVADITGRSLMVHLAGDNFSDEPKPLGGGGARLACGVIPN